LCGDNGERGHKFVAIYLTQTYPAQEFYQVNEINPLAGCLPSLAQIPIFIGLYRAVLDLAKENKLNEPFLFLPNLEGPTYGADPATAADWILQGW
jgi:YidC/Oxa1 family membrane protein insertase